MENHGSVWQRAIIPKSEDHSYYGASIRIPKGKGQHGHQENDDHTRTMGSEQVQGTGARQNAHHLKLRTYWCILECMYEC